MRIHAVVCLALVFRHVATTLVVVVVVIIVVNQYIAVFPFLSFVHLCFSRPLFPSGLQVKMPSLQPQPLHRLPSTVTRKPSTEAALAPVPARPAPVATMAPRVEGRNAVAIHNRHTAPDTTAGLRLKHLYQCQHSFWPLWICQSRLEKARIAVNNLSAIF